MNQHDRHSDDQQQALQESHESARPPLPAVQADDDWVADVKRWYLERARGVDMVKRQEVQKRLQ